MIPIEDAISTGDWFHCDIFLSARFRIKIISFKKLNLLEVDDPEKIGVIENNKIIWIMDVEIINLSKGPISPVEMYGQLYLVNQKGIKFRVYKDNHLCYNSEFSKNRKLSRFFGSLKFLNPKIKAIGAILFQLPEDDYDAKYSISPRGGNIKKV